MNIDINSLPEFLQKSIRDYEKAKLDKDEWRCFRGDYVDDVRSSINALSVEGIIDEETTRCLYENYVWIDWD